LLDRLAARAGDAAAAGRVDEARRLEQAYVLAYSAMGRPDLLTASRRTAIPNALGVGNIGDPPQHRETEERPGLPPDVSRPSTEQLGETGKGVLAASSPNPAPPASPNSAPEQKGDGARPAIPAEAAPSAPPATRVVPGLPSSAPVRVVLSVAGGGVRSSRSADIQQALLAAGLQVADLVAVGDQRPNPSIGYYFQSDRDAAAGVSHLLKPLLGAVDPVALRIRGSMPEPGTIEIAIP